MNLFFIKLKQSPIFAIILCLLLAASSAATTVGISALKNASEQEASIDENYTTIAIPKDENSTHWRMVESPYCIGEDVRLLMAARVAGSKVMSTGALNPLAYQGANESASYAMTVLAVECLEVTDERATQQDWFSTFGDYSVKCKVISYISIIDAYDLPPYDGEINISSHIRNMDGSIPFEPGKTYLVRGGYHDYSIVRRSVSENFDFEKDYASVRDPSFGRTLRSIPNLIGSMPPPMSGFYFCGCYESYPHWKDRIIVYDFENHDYIWTEFPGEWPFFTEYEGDWQDFLETDEGAVWRDEILPYMELNHESVRVMLTDNIDTLYGFNSGEADILEGRKFSRDEYRNGENVCMVSASYAKLNGLSVGDTINLDFYRTQYYAKGAGDIATNASDVILRTVFMSPLVEEGRLGVQGDFEIVGIYVSPEWNAGNHAIHADTVFVPKASVPGAELGTEEYLPVLHSMILENGSIEATEQYMAEHGHADEYVYFDQGYSDALEAIVTMKANGQRLMFIGAASLALVGLLFLWLYDRRTAKIARNMRLLGVKKSEVWAQDMKAILLLEFIAVALGTLAAAIIADADIITAVIQFVALALVSGVWTLGTVSRNLMRRK